MKWICVLFATVYLNAHSIVFVHLGPTIPEYLPATIAQARLFNKNCSIFLLGNQNALEKFTESDVNLISCESLSTSPTHKTFLNTKHDLGFNGLWVYSSERFFYLEEFVNQYNLTDVFHLENDIMLYANLEELLPAFHKNYQGMIGATFENENRCVPGFMYISDSKPLTALIEFLPKRAHMSDTDMESFARFKDKHHKTLIDYLPIVVPEYAFDYPLQAIFEKNPTLNPKLFSTHLNDFDSIFDAASWGIFLGGRNSKYHRKNMGPGYVDPYCVFNPSYFSFEWKIDAEGRRVPFCAYNGKQIRINNLHITNKILIPTFSSV